MNPILMPGSGKSSILTPKIFEFDDDSFIRIDCLAKPFGDGDSWERRTRTISYPHTDKPWQAIQPLKTKEKSITEQDARACRVPLGEILKKIRDIKDLPPQLIAQVLGDSFIAEATLNGRKLEGSYFECIAESFLEFVKAKKELVASQDKSGNSTSQFENIMVSLKGLIDFSQQTTIDVNDYEDFLDTFDPQKADKKPASSAIDDDDDFYDKEDALILRSISLINKKDKVSPAEPRTPLMQRDNIIRDLTALKPGEQLLLPGGWCGKQGMAGHAMLYVVQKQDNGNYRLEVYNTGAGLETYHQTKIVGLKEKKVPVRIFVDLDPLNFLNPESWAAYLKLMHVPPEGNIRPYDAAIIYEQWLPSLGATAEKISQKEEDQIEAITPQRVGTCTADVLFAWLRINHPSTKLYKSLKLEYKAWILAQSIFVYQKQGIFNISLSDKELATKLGTLHLLRACTEKFAISIKKAIENELIHPEDAKVYENLINITLKQIKDAETRYDQALEKQQIDMQSNLRNQDKMQISVPVKTANKIDGAVIQGQPVEQYSTQWPEPEKLFMQLQAWQKLLDGMPKTHEGNIEINTAIGNIFKNMPSVKDTAFWNKVPVKEREACMVALGNLSHQFYQSCAAIEQPNIPRFEFAASMQNLLAVMKALSSEIEFVNRCVLNTKHFSHGTISQEDEKSAHERPISESALPPAASGFTFLTDPEEDQKLTDTLLFFSDARHGSAENGLFNEDVIEYLTSNPKGKNSRLITISSKRIDELDKGVLKPDSFITQEDFAYFYLENHPDIKAQIVKELKCSKEITITTQMIIAIALADTSGKYLPPAFCMLRQQALIAQCFCNYSDYSHFPSVKLQNLHIKPESLVMNLSNHKYDLAIVPEVSDDAKFERSSFIASNPHLAQRMAFQDSQPNFRPGIEYQVVYGNLQRQNSLMINPNLKPEQVEISLLRTKDDRSQQDVKTIAYFRKKTNLLSDVTNEIYFQMLLFERGVLKQQLEHEAHFAETLASFIKEGIAYCIVNKDIPTMLFFLRMGHRFEKYCHGKSKALFPNLYLEAQQILEKKKLTNELEWLVLREQLASIAPEQLAKADITQLAKLLKKMTRLCELKNPEFEVKYSNRPLHDKITNLKIAIIKILKNQSKDLNQILSHVVGEEGVNWKMDGTVASSIDGKGLHDGKYQIDLFEGRIYKMGRYAAASLPDKVTSNEYFKLLFGPPPEITDICIKNANEISCKDRYGETCIIRAHPYEILKTIDGKLCSAYKIAVLTSVQKRQCFDYIAQTCFAWQTVKTTDADDGPQQIYFQDKKTGQISYIFNTFDQQLRCAIPGPGKGLILVDTHKTLSPDLEVFKQFDPSAQIWRDDLGQVQFIDLPKYGLHFKVMWKDGQCQVLASPPFDGYKISPAFSIAALKRFKGYLVLENDKGQRKVLIPKRWVVEQGQLNTFSETIDFQDGRLEDKLNTFYEYDVNALGRLDAPENLEAQLYLAYLYQITRNYKQALRILRRPTSQPPRQYTAAENEILHNIKENKNHDRRAEALILLIRASLLRNENIRLYPPNVQHRGSTVIPKELIKEYLEQLAHVPENTLSTEEELKVMDQLVLGHRTHIFERRQCMLADEPFADKPTIADPPHVPHVDTKFREEDIEKCLDRSIDEDILDKIPPLIHENYNWMKYFLSLYHIAQNASVSKAKKCRLLSQLRLFDVLRKSGNQPFKVQFPTVLKTILLAVLKKPDKMPPLSTLQSLFTEHKWSEAIPELFTTARRINSEGALPLTQMDALGALPQTKPKKADPVVKIKPREIIPTSPLFPTAIFEEKVSPVFVKAAKSEVDEKGDQELLNRLQDAEAQQKQRVEARSIRDLCAHTKTALQRPALENWNISHESMPKFEEELKHQLHDGEKLLKKARRAILKLANKKSPSAKAAMMQALTEKGMGQKNIKIIDLLFMYMRADENEYRSKNPAITQAEAQSLHAQIEDYMLAASRIEQLKRLKTAVEDWKECAKNPEKTALLREHTQNILNIINAKRHYNPAEHPDFLVFEHLMKLLLLPSQVASMEKMTSEAKDVMLQLIMGGGKTDILAPLLAYKNADGDKLSMIMVPEELLNLITDRMWRRAGKAFKQSVHRLPPKGWDDPDILKRLVKIIKDRGILLVTDKEMHALNLKIQNVRTDFFNQEQDRKEKDAYKVPQELKILLGIKALIKSKGHVVIDEAHRIFDCRQDSRIARINNSDDKEKTKVKAEYLRVAVVWYQRLLAQAAVKQAFKFDFFKQPGSKANPFSASDFAVIKPTLIEETLLQIAATNKELHTALSTKKAEIIRFLAAPDGSKAKLPDGLGEDLIDTLSYLRSEVLIAPYSLNSIANVRYGFFKEKDGVSLFAGPYEGAHRPKIGSQFAHLTELINFTIQMYLLEGISQSLLDKEISRIQNAVQKEMKESGILDPLQTEAYNEYRTLCGEAWAKEHTLFDLEGKSQSELRAVISGNPDLLLNFLEKYILPQIPLYEECLISDGQQIADMFAHAQTFTGTLATDTAPQRFKVIPDEGSDGIMVSTLWRNCRNNVHMLKEENDGIKILHEMLLGSEHAKEIRAIIDAGAIFKDLHHINLAREILRIRPDINAVIYFDGNQKMVLLRNSDTPFRDSQVQVPVEGTFTIYDQTHCTGTDITQLPTAHAAITMHKNLTYNDFSQAAARMRGIYRGQSLHLFLTPSQQAVVQQGIGHPIKDILDPIIYMIKVQAQQKAEDAVITLKQKMRNVVVQHCQQILEAVKIDPSNFAKYAALNRILITKNATTFTQQYGTVDSMPDDRPALEKFRDDVLRPLQTWYFEHENRALSSQIGALRKVIDTIIDAALIEGQEIVNKQISVSTAPDTERSVEITVHTQAKTQQQQNTDSKAKTDQLNSINLRGLTEAEPQLFSTERMFHHTSWRPKEYLKKKSSALDDIGCQPMASANDVYKMLQQDRTSLPPFHPRLYLSEDLMMTEHGGRFLGPVQKPFGPCLILQDKRYPKEIRMVLISGREAEAVKAALIADKARPHTEGNMRVCLYYLGLGPKIADEIYQQGSDPISAKELDSIPDFHDMRLNAKLWSGDTTASPKEIEKYKELFMQSSTPLDFDHFIKTHLIKNITAQKDYPESALFKKVFKPFIDSFLNLPILDDFLDDFDGESILNEGDESHHSMILDTNWNPSPKFARLPQSQKAKNKKQIHIKPHQALALQRILQLNPEDD